MTDYNNGQIHGWNGGDRPVHPKTEVRYWMRSVRTSDESTAYDLRWCHNESAGDLDWSHCGKSFDIIAFQVVEVHTEPKVIWMNETKGGGLVTFTSKEAALRNVSPHDVRIAVKYVEVVDDKEAKDD